MPDNPISHKVYKKIQKKLEKMELDEYHSYVGIYFSSFCKQIVILFFLAIKKLAEYVNSNNIEEVEVHIMDIIKLF